MSGTPKKTIVSVRTPMSKLLSLGKMLKCHIQGRVTPPSYWARGSAAPAAGGAWGCLGAPDQPLNVPDLGRLEGVQGIIRIIPSNEWACRNQRHQPVTPVPGAVRSRRFPVPFRVAYHKSMKAPDISLGLTFKVTKRAPMIKDTKKYVPRDRAGLRPQVAGR